jgi:hypothetical protein
MDSFMAVFLMWLNKVIHFLPSANSFIKPPARRRTEVAFALDRHQLISLAEFWRVCWWQVGSVEFQPQHDPAIRLQVQSVTCSSRKCDGQNNFHDLNNI